MPDRYPSAPELSLDGEATYRAVIHTSKGDIAVDLFASESPRTVNNFVVLARDGFYDGVIFHRIIEGFMIQGGDPTGTGTGGPGYKFADELDVAKRRGYPRGTLAMANAGPNTNGSQFFIVHRDARLPASYSVFGRVTSGLEVVDAIATTPTDRGDRPVEEIAIQSVDVSEERPGTD